MTHFSSQKIFITGIAGFIGFHLAKTLREYGAFVEGIDDLNDYYNPLLKKKRKEILETLGVKVHTKSLKELYTFYSDFETHRFTHFVHLAAQAGVRYSLTHPECYVQSNMEGFFHVLELCRRFQPLKLIFASSSSVYGLNKKTPFSEEDFTDTPASLYAATKKSNELMAHSYHHLFHIPTIGLRFFTVYGPWGRPDMAYYSFAKAIDENRSIEVYNHGQMRRDFTYIDDVIDGIVSCLNQREYSFEIFNLGNTKPEPLMHLIALLEKSLGKKAIMIMKKMQPGDVLETYADIAKANHQLQFSPKTSLEKGIDHFIDWYKNHTHF